jgi:hypothetical protein
MLEVVHKYMPELSEEFQHTLQDFLQQRQLVFHLVDMLELVYMYMMYMLVAHRYMLELLEDFIQHILPDFIQQKLFAFHLIDMLELMYR